jgi:hypothetical protein
MIPASPNLQEWWLVIGFPIAKLGSAEIGEYRSSEQGCRTKEFLTMHVFPEGFDRSFENE